MHFPTSSALTVSRSVEMRPMKIHGGMAEVAPATLEPMQSTSSPLRSEVKGPFSDHKRAALGL